MRNDEVWIRLGIEVIFWLLLGAVLYGTVCLGWHIG